MARISAPSSGVSDIEGETAQGGTLKGVPLGPYPEYFALSALRSHSERLHSEIIVAGSATPRQPVESGLPIGRNGRIAVVQSPILAGPHLTLLGQPEGPLPDLVDRRAG